MSSPSKIKGNSFEREVVNQAREFGLKSIRAYASNGMSLGEAEDVDIKIESIKGQCKRRKRIAKWLKPPESCDIALVREDRGETYVIIEYGDFLEMVAYMKELRNKGAKLEKPGAKRERSSKKREAAEAP